MHNFLRYEQIDALQLTFSGTSKGFNTNGVMCQIYIGFLRSCDVRHPFKTLRDLLIDPSRAKNLLTQDHHRLLFENYAALQPGESDHTFLTNKVWKPIMQKTLQQNPIATRTINGKRFFIFECVVRANCHADDFGDNTITQNQIERICTYHEGVAICFDIIGTEDSKGIAHTIDFFHFKFSKNLHLVQFWTVHHINKLSSIKDYLSSASIERCAAVTSVYVEELMGEAAQLGILVGFYQQFMGIEIEKKMVVQIQDGEVSTSSLQEIVLLKLNDPSFKLFRDVVDNTIKEAIVGIYGEFSEFTTPIITQSMIRLELSVAPLTLLAGAG